MTNTLSSERERDCGEGWKKQMNFDGTCSYRLCKGPSPWNTKLGFVLEQNPELQTERMETHSMPKCLHYRFLEPPMVKPNSIQSISKLSSILQTMLLVSNTSVMVNFMIAPPGSSHRPDSDNYACWISDNEQWQKVPINERSKKMYACCVYQPTR